MKKLRGRAFDMIHGNEPHLHLAGNPTGFQHCILDELRVYGIVDSNG